MFYIKIIYMKTFRKFLKLFFITLILNEMAFAQNDYFASELYNTYENYKEKSLTNRRIKNKDIIPLIQSLRDYPNFTVKKIGESFQKREINLIKFGNGKVKVFLWSQMHGDESTATMALFDLFNFLKSNDETFKNYREKFLNELQIYFLPMVNPDGAEIFQRRNILQIDLNRDAAKMVSPESRILMNTFDSLKADFGFNLHDQSTKYSVGKSFKSATISFLAPAFNYEKDTNQTRGNAIKLISELYTLLNQFIPGHIARYKDDYEPRAFGDTFQKLGTSTILIESGGWKDDKEKQFIRKINYIALLTALNSIADKNYNNYNSDIYNSIPFNEEAMFDVLIKNVLIRKEQSSEKNFYEYKVDIGINFSEINLNNATQYYLRSNIEDIGDLSTYSGYCEFNFEGYTIEEGKTYPRIFHSKSELNNLDFNKLYSEGYTNILFEGKPFENYTHFPVNIIQNKKNFNNQKISLNKPANFVLKKNNKVEFIFVNGCFYDITNKIGTIKNGLIF